MFQLVDRFELHSTYGGPPRYQLHRADVVVRAGDRTWAASAAPLTSVPPRHVQTDASNRRSLLRVVRSPALWTIQGSDGAGMLEYHDLLHDGVPAGLEDHDLV